MNLSNSVKIHPFYISTLTISILDYCFILTIIILFCITSLLLYFLIVITNINYIIITTFSFIFMTIFVFLYYITVPHNHVIIFHYCISNFCPLTPVNKEFSPDNIICKCLSKVSILYYSSLCQFVLK